MAKKKGWDGTPPVREYPYGVRHMTAYSGEPGIGVWTGRLAEGGEYFHSVWRDNDPVIRIERLTKAGTGSVMIPGNRIPDEFETVAEIPVPVEFLNYPEIKHYVARAKRQGFVASAINGWALDTFGRVHWAEY